MEGSSTALKAIQGLGHQSSVYPDGHNDIHLADVVLFNIRDTFQERRPQAFNDLYLSVLNHKSLFSYQMMAYLFAQMIFHVNMAVRNVLSDPTDNNLPLGTSAEMTPYLGLIGSPKMVGSVSSYCSILPEIVGFNIALDKGNSTLGFEPGSPAVCVDF
ncbi:hypothetical protein DSO57_1007080 [Entomophthora muscae]|uniref:Uncharacterized protein n=1 Tax=Entomophthora muscae TaxID=34485 RepID=A0ACC2RYP7_9FUNG|nr:hypothetical protein DSO57_1007080 [Entomophthora muscae]